MKILFLKPSPCILSTLKSIWSNRSPPNLNLPQFIEDMDNIISCQLQQVKSSLASKQCQSRLNKEAVLATNFKVNGYCVQKDSWTQQMPGSILDGPFVVHEQNTYHSWGKLHWPCQLISQYTKTYFSHWITKFTEKPGLITLTSHSITLTSNIPVWSPTYSVPIAHQEAFSEIDNLLELNITEPSTSKYSSPPMPECEEIDRWFDTI